MLIGFEKKNLYVQTNIDVLGFSVSTLFFIEVYFDFNVLTGDGDEKEWNMGEVRIQFLFYFLI
jgi:hypothetical protein